MEYEYSSDDINDVSDMSDDFEDQNDIGASADIVEDNKADEGFHELLNEEAQHPDPVVYGPDKPVVCEDEDEEAVDSGIETGNSDVEQKPALDSPTNLRPPSRFGYGRGRYKYMDAGEEPKILDVKPEQGFYSQAKIARLPRSYYIKREDPSEAAERRANRLSSPLIDFQATFNHISFIVDKDDSKDKGYRHACRLLQQAIPNIDNDSLKPRFDIWSFGLYVYHIKFPEPVSCNLLNLIPQEINNEENRPFWFLFQRPPTFKDPIIRNHILDESEMKRGKLIGHETYADLSYGALTTMNRFFVHKDHIIRKKTKWAIRFYTDFFEIQSNEFQRLKDETFSTLTQKKYKVPVDIIDRAATIYLWIDGFCLFLNMKGNAHEFYREREPRINEQDIFEPFIRQGIRNNKPIPLFSTIRIRFRLKDDEALTRQLEYEGKISRDTTPDEKNCALQIAREEALKQIREIFKNFLDFFNQNRIHLSFGSILSRNISIDQIYTLNCHIFPTFIQEYSWAMLCNISFRVQAQLYQAKEFIIKLQDYSNKRYDNEQSRDIDDRFYRLCLYLHRRSSEYFFLDFDVEIGIGIKEYNAKYKRAQEKNIPLPNFNQSTLSTAYVPSVVLTPTTIKIRPLKLCKLNRVLREKRFGNVFNFALIELRDEAQRLLFPTVFRALKAQILHYLAKGFHVTATRQYKYLHHSQSQVKCKQFWFYYHDRENGYLSHEDAYIWMGNFDKERVVAKHTARIAQCFTSTDATIQITADKVTYVRDIKDAKNKYAFSDGVGTISTQLRDEIKEYLGRHYEFSVIQIRYGGCKGTLSVNPDLDGKQYQLVVRDSMNKFTSDHDILEVCKLSAPRTLYLNRQDIVLLESRDIPHTNFLHFQNHHHLWLVRSLFTSSAAYELLQDKLLPVFKLREIARNINIVEEQFFIKLIITCALNIIRELLDKTRIPVSPQKARNMFGIVDEYRVLEYGQVFIQYTVISENKLHSINEEEKKDMGKCEILKGSVVVTKNPCHHPGDLRRFEAVDYPQLRHLKDVIVFPQKGHRPHSNEISGSDLDGDEYVVIWHEDLIPETKNEIPYEYDSQGDPPKMNRPITRNDINQVVMEVSEQDCLGSLANIHLAYADKYGIKSDVCTKLAGDISQEVDAAKTGKHPLTEEQIKQLRDGLDNTWPDFMKARGKRMFYPSERVLGKLYRSARRALTGWTQAITNHGSAHHIHLALSLATGADINDVMINNTNTPLYYNRPLDPLIYHPNYTDYREEIEKLYGNYRYELLDIISLYRFQDEIDLFCRCESMDSSVGANKKGGLEDSATIEVKNLIQRISQDFYYEFNQRYLRKKCCRIEKNPDRGRERRIDCDTCADAKSAKAACAYIYSYEESNRLPLKSNRRILSFPWLFSTYLIRLRDRNMPKDHVEQSNSIVGRACSLYLQNLIPKFKVYVPNTSDDIQTVELYYTIKTTEQRTSLFSTNKKSDETIPFGKLSRVCFAEILHDWLLKQNIFGDICNETDPKPLIPECIWHELLVHFLSYEHQPNARLVFARKDKNLMAERYRETIVNYSLKNWTVDEYKEFLYMFRDIHSLAVQHAKRTNLTIWTYLEEYIILALQCIGIEKKLVDKWI